ncbi:hypothetical protein SLS64_003389 [Diaporthe eres]|uniref:Uncharacterized protein n=1 Tax=Diaporthe eres TaxID=83184 RepID=A0ABR1PHT9_DIAER
MKVSAQNAFIPGEMDIATGGPSIFSEEENRDYYYHVGFEVCHILLAYARELDAAYRSEQTVPYAPAATAEQTGDNILQPRRGLDSSVLDEILAELKKQRTLNQQHANDYRTLAQLLGADGRLDRRRTSMVMKKSMPFNNMIDASNITNLDEEWLYNYPDFLLTKNIDLHQQLKPLLATSFDPYRPVDEYSSVIVKALVSMKGSLSEVFSSSDSKLGWTFDGMVASLPKQKTRRQKRGKRDFGALVSFLPFSNPNEELWNTIGKARSAMKAKKRFLWLPLHSKPQTALLCWLASIEPEKSAMSIFFDRHAKYENHLWDDTTMVLNVWQTELHLSFWVIYEKKQPLCPGLPNPITAPWPRGSEKELRRAAISFRFDGDFFDRYWTCHFIKYVPGGSAMMLGVPGEAAADFHRDKQCWQRKVLELQLLQHMLWIILNASNGILDQTEADLGLKKGNLVFSVLTTEAYSLSEDRWQIYEELLQKAEEDITSSLSTLSKWATREVDRGQERPRWTRNDERKYRGYINKLRNYTERQRWDLENCRDKMCKLRETLITRRDNVRADLEANREQNIRYFTYVTVIFLPLGFASSFYSMNGAPSNDLIVSLAKFATAAFAVTAILVFGVGVFLTASAKALSVVNSIISVAKQPIYVANGRLQEYSHKTRLDSLLVKGTSSDNELHKSQTLHQAYLKKDWMVSPWFWPAHVFLEVPTRMVSSAWTTLGTGNLSVNAIWSVAIGIVVLPIYAISRAVLISFGNSMLLLTISKHLYQLSVDWLTTKRNSEETRMPQNKVVPDESLDEQALPRRSSFEEPPKNSDDAENITAANRILPDHFKQLMPTTEPLALLKSFEGRLNKRRLKHAEGGNAEEKDV